MISDQFIPVVFGPQWIKVVPVLKILSLAGIMQAIGTTFGYIYMSQGRTITMNKWGIYSGSVRVISIIIGLKWGITGVAFSYVMGGYIFLWYPGWVIAGRIINIKFMEMINNIYPVFYVHLVWEYGYI